MDTDLDPEHLARLQALRLPRHLAVIMDGNGRWAEQRGMARHAGHRAGVSAVRTLVEACARLKLEALTLFAFSSENWQRPRTEVRVLMELLGSTVERELDQLHQNGIRLRIIGDRDRLDRGLRQRLDAAEQLTRGNQGLNLIVATSYGGRWEIARAARTLATRVANGEIEPEAVTEAQFGACLSEPDLPEPDLFIRTGGEKRVSNFLLWQLAYTELFFSDVLWPDFGLEDLGRALEAYAARNRRFGQVSAIRSAPQHA